MSSVDNDIYYGRQVYPGASVQQDINIPCKGVRRHEGRQLRYDPHWPKEMSCENTRMFQPFEDYAYHEKRGWRGYLWDEIPAPYSKHYQAFWDGKNFSQNRPLSSEMSCSVSMSPIAVPLKNGQELGVEPFVGFLRSPGFYVGIPLQDSEGNTLELEIDCESLQGAMTFGKVKAFLADMIRFSTPIRTYTDPKH